MDVAGSAMVSWWSLSMLLFVAVNAHAAWTCLRTLRDEQRTTAHMRRQRCARKRLRGDSEPGRSAGHCAVVWTRTPGATSSNTRCKRRRLQPSATRGTDFRHAPPPPWPWPVHVSFMALDIVGDGEKRMAAWLAHPWLVSARAKVVDVLQSALQEVLVSFVSFALCTLAVVLLRRYSTLVVGVSVDLGAFSLEV